MLLFGLLACALALIVAFAMLRPLWARARLLAIVLALSCTVIALGLYRVLGTPLALDPMMVRSPANATEAIAQLEAQLKADPANVESWRVLAQAYGVAGRHPEAAEALSKAVAIAVRASFGE